MIRQLSRGAALCVVAAVALACAPAMAQNQLPSVRGRNGPVDTTPTVQIGYDSSTGLPCVVGATATCALKVSASVSVTTGALAPAGVTTTTVGSSVTTAQTFQTALAAAPRNGCLITNTSNDIEYIFVGPTASALLTKIIPIAPNGGWFSCNSGVIVIQDNIAITSATLNGATFTVNSQ